MATVLDRVPLERIAAEAREVHVGRTLLTLLAGFFYLVGWLAGTLVGGAGWCVAAVKVGWRESRPGPVRSDGGG